jgi:arylsulfatase
MRKRTILPAAPLAAAILIGCLGDPGVAQGTAKPGEPQAQAKAEGQHKAEARPEVQEQPPETPSVLPRPDFRFPGSVGRTYLDSDPAQFPQPVQAPPGAPNVLLILIDDAASASSAPSAAACRRRRWTGSRPRACATTASTPTALCSPTRAALITGRNHHSAASPHRGGGHGLRRLHLRAAAQLRDDRRGAEAERLYDRLIGKNHNTPAWETSAAGPFDRWANGLGFEYFYGFNAGDMNHWNPVLFENRNLVPASSAPGYHLTADLADHAIAWVAR